MAGMSFIVNINAYKEKTIKKLKTINSPSKKHSCNNLIDKIMNLQNL